MLLLSKTSVIYGGLYASNSNDQQLDKNLEKTANEVFTENFDKQVAQFMDKNHIPSMAISLVYKDELVWANGYGEHSDNDTVYHVASIVKSFVATAILQLYEQDLVDLDDDVNDYLPFVLKNPKYPDVPITVRLLLSHRSGLLFGTKNYWKIVQGGTGPPFPLTIGNPIGPPYPNYLEELLVPNGAYYTSDIWSNRTPGDPGLFVYSDIGFDILGYLIELISNQTIEEYMSEHIWVPLEMEDTKYNFTHYSASRLAYPYVWDTENNVNNKFPHYNSKSKGADALKTTVIDLSHFLIAHMNDGEYNDVHILNKASIELMHSEHGYYYGFGWITDFHGIYGLKDQFSDVLQGHSGGNMGFRTTMYFNKEKKIGVIMFANQGYYESTIILNAFINNTLFQTAYQLADLDTYSTVMVPELMIHNLFGIILLALIVLCKKKMKLNK